MDKQELIDTLKQKVTEASAKPNFRHSTWFVKWHLEIVENICQELLILHPEADTFKVVSLAWLHDYEKIIDFDNQYNTELTATRTLMHEVGFDDDFIEAMCTDLNIYNAKENLQNASIEVQIVSSSDAASHMVGPFTPIYWHENPNKTIDDLLTENYRKLQVDWEQKIVLPEVKNAFTHRYQSRREVAGRLPEKFIISE